MNARGVVVVLALSLFVLSAPKPCAADGWWPSSSGGKSTSSTAAKKSSSSSWWPWSSSKPKSKSHSKSKPSTLDKVSKSTKNAWNKSLDFLNPFDDKPAVKEQPQRLPNDNGWFSSRRPEDQPRSVPEWMAGERPSF